MTGIIVGLGRKLPLVKIRVCLRTYHTSHRGWIKSCSLSGQPSKNPASSSQGLAQMNNSGLGLIPILSPGGRSLYRCINRV